LRERIAGIALSWRERQSDARRAGGRTAFSRRRWDVSRLGCFVSRVNARNRINKEFMKMKIENKVKVAKLTACLLASGLMSGCTHYAARREKVSIKLAEESKALTTAVVDVLQNQPSTNRDLYTETALTFARQDQRVEGLPLEPFDVVGLLTNSPAAREEVTERFAAEEKLIAARAKVDEKLINFGERAEAERNRRIGWWTRVSTLGLGLIAGCVALCVFCPLALPLVGRGLGWLVGKLPGLASAVGVVSVKAFDAVVRGVEKAKKQNSPVAPTVPVANTFQTSGDSRRDKATWIEQLENNLSREMDAAHKALVRSRKGVAL
jgi:hypothetical protein